MARILIQSYRLFETLWLFTGFFLLAPSSFTLNHASTLVVVLSTHSAHTLSRFSDSKDRALCLSDLSLLSARLCLLNRLLHLVFVLTISIFHIVRQLSCPPISSTHSCYLGTHLWVYQTLIEAYPAHSLEHSLLRWVSSLFESSTFQCQPFP